MNIEEYSYDLPDNKIALRPPSIRGASKLLVLNRNTKTLIDDKYSNLYKYLNPEDVLVLNNTRVIKARLLAKTENGQIREILILERHDKDFSSNSFKVIYRRKIIEGQTLSIDNIKLKVQKVLDGGIAILSCDQDLYDLANKHGNVPLPPYMHREADNDDVQRYQTVFAKYQGSVAAPTASLNFTDTLKDKLTKKGVKIVELTLHVGLGTFMPIRSDKIESHVMHQEYFEIPKSTIETINKASETGHKVIALGTTVTRALEFSAEKIKTAKTSANGEANIFIYPGYEFKVIDGMLTNFHAPKSTVLMMAAAFGGFNFLMDAYQHALSHNYMFLSYGDSMLIL